MPIKRTKFGYFAPEDEFWLTINVVGDCWEWAAGKDGFGYGKYHRFKRGETTHVRAYILTYGSIPNGLSVLHKCDNPPCINPEHLYTGTQKDNMQDRFKRGRANIKRKLTQEQIEFIIARHRKPYYAEELAEMFGVHWATIHRIIHKSKVNDKNATYSHNT